MQVGKNAKDSVILLTFIFFILLSIIKLLDQVSEIKIIVLCLLHLSNFILIYTYINQILLGN